MHFSAHGCCDLLQSSNNLSKAWSTRGLHMPAFGNKLQKTLIVAISDAKLLAALYLASNLSCFEPIKGHLTLECLPEERSECEHVHLLIVLALLEELRGHVAWCACELHRSGTQVSLTNISV